MVTGESVEVEGKATSTLPEHNVAYLEPAYWDRRFQHEESYEWFKGYAQFRHLLLPHMRPSDRILILGCGNSALAFDLCNDGIGNVTSLDISPVVIDRMRTRSAELGLPQLVWTVGDMLSLPFPDGAFDVVIEKGTMDVLFVDQQDPWAPSPGICSRVHRMLTETHRVLTATGTFFSVTFAQPHFRRPILRSSAYDWSLTVDHFGDSFHYFVYRLRRGEAPLRADEDDAVAASNAAPKHVSDMTMHAYHEHMDKEDYLLRTEI